MDSVIVDKAKNEHNVPILKEPTYNEQKSNSAQYQGDLQVGDYVYKQFDAKLFDKSFDVSVKVFLSKPFSFLFSINLVLTF